MDTSRLVRSFRAFLGGAIVAALVANESAAQAAPELCESPRLGVVCKGKTAALAPKLVRLSETFLASGVRVEIVALDKLPTKSSKTPSPRFVMVLEEAHAAPTGAVTEEYESAGAIGQTSRIRWRGALAHARATLHECGSEARKIGEFTETIDRTRPPKSHVFGLDEAKKEIAVDPALLLGTALENITRHTLAFAAGKDLWFQRADLGRIVADLGEDDGAEFWSRAAWTAGEPAPMRAVVPWRSLETAALGLWRRANAKSAARAHPVGGCAWCGAAPNDVPGECTCAEATALAGALCVLRCSAERGDQVQDPKAATAPEIAWDRLLPSRPPAPGPELEAVARRLDLEHAADLAVLRTRLGLREMKPQARLDWYVVLALREPLVWEPDDPDLVRHSAHVIQAFGIRTGIAGASFDVESASPVIGLVQRRSGWEYTAVEKREFTSAKTDLLAAFVERALWANARGTPKAP